MSELLDVLDENGQYTGKTATRKECHEKGLWHKTVVLFILSENGKKVLLQQRSAQKKPWPDKWDNSVGGHVDAGEFGYSTVIRETKEEIGIDIAKEDISFIGSIRIKDSNRGKLISHFSEFYVLNKDIDISKLVFQKEEVQDVKWFEKEEIIKMINCNDEMLTGKKENWQYLQSYLNRI